MNKKKLWMTLFYAANLITILILIGWVIENPFLNIILALYLVVFSGIYIYATRKK